MSDLPEGWVKKESTSHPGRPYYFNVTTGVSQWDKPNSAKKVKASHILVKHKESRRPSSWKEENITRSKDEAIQKILEFKKMIDSGQEKFEEIAARESDCASAKHGGDLGYFGTGQMQKPFEEAAFSIKVGELTGPIYSESGVHLILRTA